MEKEIAEIVGQHASFNLDATTLPADADLFDLGLSSYGAVQVMMALEEKYDVVFPDELMKKEHFSTIRKLTAAVRSARSGGI